MATRAREQILQEAHELSFLSTVLVLIVGTLAMTGIPSGGSELHTRRVMRDAWVVYWSAAFLLALMSTNAAFLVFCALNSCDDDAEVLRIVDSLSTTAVLPHRLFTGACFMTCAGLIFWSALEFSVWSTLCVAALFLIFVAGQVGVAFHIVRASVSSKSREVEGPREPSAMRRAASKASLMALVRAAVDDARVDVVPLAGSDVPVMPLVVAVEPAGKPQGILRSPGGAKAGEVSGRGARKVIIEE
jgi:hypothetical protein